MAAAVAALDCREARCARESLAAEAVNGNAIGQLLGAGVAATTAADT